VKRRGQPETSTCQEDIRRRKLAEVRERIAEVAAIVVRLPPDRAAVNVGREGPPVPAPAAPPPGCLWP